MKTATLAALVPAGLEEETQLAGTWTCPSAICVRGQPVGVGEGAAADAEAMTDAAAAEEMIGAAGEAIGAAGDLAGAAGDSAGAGEAMGAGVETTTGPGATDAKLTIDEQLSGTCGWPSPIWVTGHVTGAGVETIVETMGVGEVMIVEVIVMGGRVTTMVLGMAGAGAGAGVTIVGTEIGTGVIVLLTGTVVGAGVGVIITGMDVMMEEQLRGTWGWPSPIWVTGQVTGRGLEVMVVMTGVGVVWTVEVMVTGGKVTTVTLVTIGAVVCVV